MGKRSIVVMGATGQIGLALTDKLIKRGLSVRALDTDVKALQKLKEMGAECKTIEAYDRSFSLAEAFSEADALFCALPTGENRENYAHFQEKVSEAIVNAVKKCRIRYILNLSSLGAQAAEGTGPIACLHRHEERLNTLSHIHIVHLRTAYCMENLYWYIPTIRKNRILTTPIRSDLKIPMVATKDLAERAADFLDHLHFRGHEVIEYFGPRSITFLEVSHLLAQALGIEVLPYRQEPLDEARKHMLEAKMKADTVELFLEMYKGMNKGLFHPTQLNSVGHVGSTTIEEFMKTIGKL